MAAVEAAWISQQKKAFGMWVDTQLDDRGEKLRTDVPFGHVFDNGLQLVTLAEVVTKDHTPMKVVKTPKMRVQQIENCNIALKLLEHHGFHSDTSAEMMVDGDEKMVLGFIYQLFVKFVGGDPKDKSNKTDELLEWVKERVGPRGKDIHGWTNDWKDGVAFAALLDSMSKNLLDLDSVNKDDGLALMASVFDVAQKQLDVAPLLSPELTASEPDDKCIKMYVTLLRQAWQEKGAAIDEAAAAARAKEEEKRAREAAKAAAAAAAAAAEAERRAAMTIDQVWAERDEFAKKAGVNHPMIGDVVPDFTQESSEGPINFHEWAGSSWVILFSHPADFTPVCTTELGAVAKLAPEWAARNIKPIALSVDSAESHAEWIKDINEVNGCTVNFPILADSDRLVANLYGMIHPNAPSTMQGKLTVRSVFIIDPNKVLKLTLTYPASTGRNFAEIIRVIDSLQLTLTRKLATPADWTSGNECVIVPSVSNEEADTLFPGYRTIKPYLRMVTPQ